MIIRKEKWNMFTCKYVLELMKEYNQTAPKSMQFYFHNSGPLKDRLQHGPVTFAARREDFDSTRLAKDAFKNDLSYTDFMTLEEYIEHELHQDPKAKFIRSGLFSFKNPFAEEA